LANGLLNCHDARRVIDVEYIRLLVGSDRRVRFTDMQLQNDDDLRTMFSIFSHYYSEETTELDVTLVRYIKYIYSSLIRPMNLDEIVTCMVEPDDDEVVNLFHL
jgi:hypothetical protein